MKINPIWTICLIVRICLLLSIRFFYNNRVFKYIAIVVLLGIGLGFLYKCKTGSNNEKQLSKVFWHNTRCLHSFFYILAAYYLYCNKINMINVILSTDICFSILYRIITNQ